MLWKLSQKFTFILISKWQWLTITKLSLAKQFILVKNSWHFYSFWETVCYILLNMKYFCFHYNQMSLVHHIKNILDSVTFLAYIVKLNVIFTLKLVFLKIKKRDGRRVSYRASALADINIFHQKLNLSCYQLCFEP